VMTVTMPMAVSAAITIPLLILISVFIAIVAPTMLFPLRFPFSVFEFFVRPHTAPIRPGHRLQVRHVLGSQPERVERPHVELAGRRNSKACLERAYREQIGRAHV